MSTGNKSSESASNGASEVEENDERTPEVVVEYRPTRRRLPKSRPSQTTSFTVGGAEGYMTAGSYPDNGLGEIFLKLGKQGSTLAGVMDAFSIAVSIGLQYGVPLETYVQKFTNLRFDPAGITDDADIRMAQSIMDYIFRRLALDFLPPDRRAALGIYSADERQQQVEGAPMPEAADAAADTGDSASLRQTPNEAYGRENGVVPEVTGPSLETAHSSPEVVEAFGGTTDAPLCFTCGTKMRPAGTCYVCEGCGSTSGCS